MTDLAEVIASLAEIEFSDIGIPHALYRLYDTEGVLLYIGITWNLPQRMEAHAADKDWWPEVARRTMVWYASELDARKAEAKAIELEDPVHNDVRPAVGPRVPPHGQRAGWHREVPVAVRFGEDRQRLEDFARDHEQPVHRVVRDAVRHWLNRPEPATGEAAISEEQR